MRATGWIGAPPATSADLQAADRKLGRTLPPSLRGFLSITDGWPVLSMGFGAVRPVQDLGWVVDLDPDLVRIWEDAAGELEPDVEREPWLLRRALLLSTGSDCFLLDPGRVDGGTGEWESCGFTSWYPGAGEPTSSFRTGVDRHYATFVRFTAPESMTRAEVAAQVHKAYRSSLRGDPSGEWIVPAARHFGDHRADVLDVQLRTLDDAYRAPLAVQSLDWERAAADPCVVDDLLPLFVTACLDPHDPHDSALDWLVPHLPEPLAGRVRELADRCRRDGGLTADWPATPAFAAAADRARTLTRAGRDDDAFDAVVAGLPHWQPLSPAHLAPMGLVWDRELGRLMTPARRRRLLTLPRGVPG